MLESWRWFGPRDAIGLEEVAQTGARGIVTALHDIPYGEVWPSEEISRRKALIASAPGNMHWAVVESLPVHEDIRRGQGKLGGLFANHRQSLDNLTAEAAHTVCCTFMPILDWTRLHLDAPLDAGGHCLRYSRAPVRFHG